MKDRFENKETLIATLMKQLIIQGNRDLAAGLADSGELAEYPAGANIIEQDASDRDVHFLLSGSARIIINGVRHHVRPAGITLGEMSALNPTLARSATLCAEETTVTWKVDGDQFVDMLNKHPAAWPLLAADLASRIQQRNQFVNPSNRRPRVFIICSAEALEIAEELQLILQHEDAVVTIWSDTEIFPPGAYALDVLEEQVRTADFGIAIASPDDIVRARDRTQPAPRDNVIFELGFFVSRLGKDRTMLLIPEGQDVKIPSDYKGITPIRYSVAADDIALGSALAPTATAIKKTIRKLKVRSSFQVAN